MESKKEEKKRLKKIRKKYKRTYRNVFFLFFLFMFGSFYFFYRTVIPFSIVVAILVISGIIGAYIDHKRYSYAHKYEGWFGFLATFFYYTLLLGTFVVTVFLGSNYYLSGSSVKTLDYEIIDRHSVSGGKYHRSERKPVFIVRIDGKEKEFEYSHTYYADMDSYQSISLKTTKGFWGFDVIKGRQLNK